MPDRQAGTNLLNQLLYQGQCLGIGLWLGRMQADAAVVDEEVAHAVVADVEVDFYLAAAFRSAMGDGIGDQGIDNHAGGKGQCDVQFQVTGMDDDGDLVLLAIRPWQFADDAAQVFAEAHCFADVQVVVGIRAQDESDGVPLVFLADGDGGASGIERDDMPGLCIAHPEIMQVQRRPLFEYLGHRACRQDFGVYRQ